MEGGRIEQFVTSGFPSPIAFVYGQMIGEVSPERRIMYMENLADVLIRYLTAIAASDFIRCPAHRHDHRGTRDNPCPNPFCRVFSKESIPLGNFVRLLRECTAALRTSPIQPFVPELVAFHSAHFKDIDDLVRFRNREWGHRGGTATTGFYENLYASQKPQFDSVLHSLMFLSQYPLVAPADWRKLPEGRFQYNCYFCMGELLHFKATYSLQSRFRLEEGNLYVHHRASNDIMDLSPLMMLLEHPPGHRRRIMFVQKVSHTRIEFIDLQERLQEEDRPALAPDTFAQRTGIDLAKIQPDLRSEAVSVPESRGPEIILPLERRQISSPYAAVGQDIDVVVRLVNTGTTRAVGVTFEERLPDGLQCVRGSASIGPETLEPRQPRPISYTVRAEQEGEYLLAPTSVRYRDESGREYATPVPADTLVIDLRYDSAMVGRAPELEKLKRWFTAARVGSGRVVLITGEAGVGKSRLAQELCAWALAQGARVFHGKCRDRSAGPFHPFLRAREVVLKGDQVEDAPGDPWGDQQGFAGPRQPASALLSSAGLSPPGLQGEGHGAERFSQAESLRNHLIGLTRRDPVVFLLDDLQWADRDTLVFLLDILASLESLRLLFLATYRLEEVDDTLQDVLSRMRRESQICHTVALPRLDAAGCEEMLQDIMGAAVDRSLSDRIFAESQGNPFYIREIVKMLRERDHIRRENGCWVLTRDLSEIDVPSAVYELILRRLQHLSREHRGLLEFASVEGVIFTVDRAFVKGFRLIAGEDTHESRLAVAGAALRRDLGWLERVYRIIRSRADRDDAFEFDHAKIREALYWELKHADRAFYHRAIGQSMEEEYLESGGTAGDLFELAGHFHKGEEWAKAARYLREAGEKASGMAAYASADHYFDLAEQALERTRLAPDSRLALVIDLAVARADHEAFRGEWVRHQQNLEALREQARELEDQSPYVRLLLTLSELYTYSDRYAESRALVEEAHTLASRHNLARESATALSRLAYMYDHFGDYEAALRDYGAALRIARELGDPRLEVQILGDLATVEYRLGNHLRTLSLNQEALTISRQHGLLREEAILMRYRGLHYKDMADWTAALQWLERSLEVRRQIGDPRGEAFVLTELADVLPHTGRTAEAITYCQRAVGLLIQLGDARAECGALFELASLYVRTGDPSRQFELLQQALAIAERIPEDRQQECSALRRLGLAEQSRGNRDQAVEYLQRALATARAGGLKHEEARTLNTIGDFYAKGQRYDEAEASYRSALETYLAAGRKKEAAEVFNALGSMHASQGRDQEALSAHERALELAGEAQDLLGETATLRKIAHLHRTRKAFDAAARYYSEALAKDRERGNKGGEGYSLLGLAELSAETSRPDQALEYYEQGLRIRQETGDLEAQSFYHRQVARIREDLKQYAEALPHRERALAIARALNDTGQTIIDLRGIARMYRGLRDWENALTHYQEARHLCEQTGDRPELQETLVGIGLTYRGKGDYPTAVEYLREAIDITRERNRHEDLWGELLELGDVYLKGDMAADALSCFEEALALAKQRSNRVLQAAALLRMSGWHEHESRHESALALQEEALTLYRAERDQIGEGRVLLAMATTCYKMGRLHDALTHATESLGIRRVLQDRPGESACLTWIGRTHRKLGDLNKALEFHEQALHLDRELGDKAGQAADLEDIAADYRSLGREEEARQCHDQALALRMELEDVPGQARLLDGMARAFYRARQIPRAVDYYRQAHAMYERAGDVAGRASTRLGLGYCFLQADDHGVALTEFQEALNLFEQIQDSGGQIHALLGFGEAMAHTDPAAAPQVVHRALQLSASQQDEHAMLMAHRLLGRLHIDRHDLDSAIRAYLEAVALAERLGEKVAETYICTRLGRLFRQREDLDEARRWLERAVALDEAIGNQEYLIINCLELAEVAVAQRDQTTAVEMLQKALANARRAGGGQDVVRVCQRLATALRAMGDPQASREYLLEALGAAEQAGLQYHVASTLLMLCRTSQLLKDPREARDYGERCMAVAQSAGRLDVAVLAAFTLAVTHTELGELEAAEGLLMQALDLARQLQDAEHETKAYINLGSLHYRMGDNDKARSFLEQALIIDRRLGHKRWEAEALRLMARTFATDDHQRAEALYNQSMELYESLEDLRGKAHVLEELARMFQQQNRQDQARAFAEQALRLNRLLEDPVRESLNLSLLVDVAAASGDLSGAIEHARAMLELDTRLENLQWEAGSCLKLASLLFDVDREEALRLLERAHALYIGLGRYKRASSVAHLIYRGTERWRRHP